MASSAAAGGATPPAPETRDWAALPRDILSMVFLKLGPREVMLGAEFACTAWRRAALDEPALWRRVGMDKCHKLWRYVKMEHAMNLAAVERSACQCEAFKGILLAPDLLDLAQRAPSLKTLNLEHSRDEERSIEELTEALEKFPLLEDLTIYLPYVLMKEDDDLLGYICHACPRLKKLVVMYASRLDLECNEGEFSKQPIDGGTTLMPELRSLELYQVDLSIEGLNDILDNCPVLESLYVDGYFNRRAMDKDLRLKCARVKNLTLPSLDRYYEYSSDQYDYYSSEGYDDNSEDDSEDYGDSSEDDSEE